MKNEKTALFNKHGFYLDMQDQKIHGNNSNHKRSKVVIDKSHSQMN